MPRTNPGSTGRRCQSRRYRITVLKVLLFFYIVKMITLFLWKFPNHFIINFYIRICIIFRISDGIFFQSEIIQKPFSLIYFIRIKIRLYNRLHFYRNSKRDCFYFIINIWNKASFNRKSHVIRHCFNCNRNFRELPTT
jgi:hypothetical protein